MGYAPVMSRWAMLDPRISTGAGAETLAPSGAAVTESGAAGAGGVLRESPEPGEAAGDPGAVIGWPPVRSEPGAATKVGWNPSGRLSRKLNLSAIASFLSELNEAKKPPAVRNASL